MSMPFIRSATGCFACKTKRKKCDETKPHCLRCQKSRMECPGYTYIQDPCNPAKKLRTLPAPRTVLGRSRDTAQGAPSTNAQESGVQLQNQLPRNNDLLTPRPIYNVPGTSVNLGMLPETTDISNQLVPLSSFSRPLQHYSSDLSTPDPLAVDIADCRHIPPPPSTSTATPMTSGQASLLAALLSLGLPLNQDIPPQGGQPVANSSVSDIGQQHGVTSHEDLDQEGSVSVISHQLMLDKTVESNALPFVLQNCAAWISRQAFEPEKLIGITRDFVFSHFEDGQVQSRLIIGLLANVASRIGSGELVEVNRNPLLSTLQSALRQRLRTVKSQPHLTRSEVIKVLDCAIEAIHMHCYLGCRSQTLALKLEVLPIVRQLCAESSGAPLNPLSLLHHPVGSVRRFAEVDIFFSVTMEIPSLLQYDLDIPASQPPSPTVSTTAMHRDGIVQWLHGVPNQLILAFAKMLSMRTTGSTNNKELIASVERDIRDLQPYNVTSSERYIVIMRSVVQECWKQVALVYLYMAVCGDPSGTPRVKEAVQRFMRLVEGTRPGRLPDEFLALPLLFISPAAQSKRDRKIIKQRMLGLYGLAPPFLPSAKIVYSVEGRWAHADAEGRQGLWSDIAWSHRQGLPV